MLATFFTLMSNVGATVLPGCRWRSISQLARVPSPAVFALTVALASNCVPHPDSPGERPDHGALPGTGYRTSCVRAG